MAAVSDNLHNFLKNTPQQSPLLSMDNNDIFAVLQKLGENLDNLLLARDLVRQSLVYACYHARVPKMKEVRTMTWTALRWVWRLEAPLFIGMPPAGALNRCRPYVPAHVL